MFDKIKKYFKNGNSDPGEIKDSDATTSPSFEQRMKSLENYFKHHSQTEELFLPEFEAAKKINQIALKSELSASDFKQIVQIFNTTNLKSHYSGSGWFDFKLHIQTLLRQNNVKFETLPNTNIELIKNN